MYPTFQLKWTHNFLCRFVTVLQIIGSLQMYDNPSLERYTVSFRDILRSGGLYPGLNILQNLTNSLWFAVRKDVSVPQMCSVVPGNFFATYYFPDIFSRTSFSPLHFFLKQFYPLEIFFPENVWRPNFKC